jgi:CubicO group peptidase (beta-lactamase class C family)
MRRWASLLVFTVFVGWAPVAEAGDLPPEQVSRVSALARTFLERTATEHAAPTALSLAVGLNGDMVLARGFGQATPGSSADAMTLYHVGSLTKPFVAAAVLKMSTRSAQALTSGAVLALDQPVSLFFHKAELWDGEAPVTVRKLLTMTSNLPNFTRRPPRDVDPWGAISSQQLLDTLQHQAPHGLGSSFEYSNTNYFLLAALLEAVVEPEARTPRGYREVLTDDVFLPAGMRDTRFIGEPPGEHNLAAPHFRHSRPAFNSPDWLKGSADVVSSARDIFKWNKALMEGRVLAPELRAMMFAEWARVAPLQFYGMGWFIEHEGNRDIYFHSGTVPGYAAYNMIAVDKRSPDWISVTLLANSDAVEDLDDLAARILDAVAR